MSQPSENPWPALPYAEWQETCTALHLWTQIAGKYRLAHAPWVNHSWHATLYLTPSGLTTGPVPDAGGRTVGLDFDLYEHRLVARADGGAVASFALERMSVAEVSVRVAPDPPTPGVPRPEERPPRPRRRVRGARHAQNHPFSGGFG